MTLRVGSIREAYAVLGLEPCAGFSAAKSAFRDRAKRLHPDITPPSPDTLSELADIVSAIRFLEAHRPACLAVEISAFDAEMGVARALKFGDKPIIVRIPPGTLDGAEIPAVGEDDVMVTVNVKAAPAKQRQPDMEDMGAQLDDFISEFSRPSAVSRLARWIRKSQSAA